MATEHRAGITWSQALSEDGSPTSRELIDPARIDPDGPGDHEGA